MFRNYAELSIGSIFDVFEWGMEFMSNEYDEWWNLPRHAAELFVRTVVHVYEWRMGPLPIRVDERWSLLGWNFRNIGWVQRFDGNERDGRGVCRYELRQDG